MNLPLEKTVPRIRFVVVKALGDETSSFGKSVVEHLQEFLSVLPEGVLHAACIDGPNTTPDLGSSLLSIRKGLVTLENIGKIEKLGFRVDGTEADRYKVLFIIVSALQDVKPEAIKTLDSLLSEYPADGLILLCQTDPDSKGIESAAELGFPGTLCMVSQAAASGVTVGTERMVTEAAGTILLSLLPDIHFRLDTGVSSDDALFVGFSGYYGIAGPALERLAQLSGSAVIGAQLAEDKSGPGGDLPEKAVEFLEDFSPRNLVRSLFDPVKVKSIDAQGIPFGPDWNGRTLLAHGGTGTPDLRLKETPERQWSSRIREFSRAFDMTLGARWNRQMQAASLTVQREVKEKFPERFSGLLENIVRSPYHLERLLNALGERVREKRTSQPPPSGDLGSALDEMDLAIAERPNGLLVATRLALWLIPSLAIGTGLLFSLYPAARATLISAVLVVAGLAAGAGYVVLLMERADRRVEKAKKNALDILVEQQECVVASNALGYLEEVALVVGACLDQAKNRLKKYREALENAKKTIDEAVLQDIPSHPPFTPVLSEASQYRTVFDGIGIDVDTWLKEAVTEGMMGECAKEQSGEGAWGRKLVDWCKDRLGKGEGVKIPSFRDLFDISAGNLVGSGTTLQEKLAGNLYRWAEPLAYAIGVSEKGSLVVPAELYDSFLKSLESGNGTPLTEKDLVDAGNFPMVCCSRIRTIKARQVEE